MPVPFSGSLLWQAGLLLLACGLLGFFLFFAKFLQKAGRRRRGEQVKRRGYVAGATELMLFALLTVSGGFAISLSAIQRVYHVFTERRPVAQIQARMIDKSAKKMQVVLLVAGQTQEPEEYRYLLTGDQWMIEGNILTWDDYLTVYGFRPAYRLTRLRGRFVATEEEKRRTPSVFALNDEEYETRWRWLLRYAAKFPGLRMAYGQTVFTYPDENKIFLLRIGHDGFTLEESENAISQTQKF